jgi:hypothetical protein
MCLSVHAHCKLDILILIVSMAQLMTPRSVCYGTVADSGGVGQVTHTEHNSSKIFDHGSAKQLLLAAVARRHGIELQDEQVGSPCISGHEGNDLYRGSYRGWCNIDVLVRHR